MEEVSVTQISELAWARPGNCYEGIECTQVKSDKVNDERSTDSEPVQVKLGNHRGGSKHNQGKSNKVNGKQVTDSGTTMEDVSATKLSLIK